MQAGVLQMVWRDSDVVFGLVFDIAFLGFGVCTHVYLEFWSDLWEISKFALTKRCLSVWDTPVV